MSHSPSPVTLKDVPSIVTAEPFRLAKGLQILAVVMIAVGVYGFAREAFGGGDPRHAWSAFQVNFIYWFCIAIASTGFTAVFHICNAQWARPLKRLFEAGSAFLIYCPLILLFLFAFRAYDSIFSWAGSEIPGKSSWLQPGAVYVRDIIAMIVLILISKRLVHWSIRRDIGAIRSGLTGLSKEQTQRWHEPQYDCYVQDWGSDAHAELRKIDHLMGRFSPPMIMVYALVMTLIAFDQVMSVDPHWYSTMFGAFVFMGAVYLAVAWTSMSVAFVRTHPLFRAKVERRTLHDLGKLLFGFGIFWAYLFWSQYLPIWYSNMPEETGYMILRLREEPWHQVGWMVLGLCFFIPFLLGLSRDVKQIPQLLFCTGMIAACGMWVQHYLLFVPTLFPDHIPYGFTDVSITLAFFGAYLLSVTKFLEKVPLMPFGDLYVYKPSH